MNLRNTFAIIGLMLAALLTGMALAAFSAPTVSPMPTTTPASTPTSSPRQTATPAPTRPTATPVPARPTEAPAPRTHVVQAGDTLSSIARRYGVTVEQLAAANDIRNPDLLVPGQLLSIPEGSAPVPTRTTTSQPATPTATATTKPAEPTATPTAEPEPTATETSQPAATETPEPTATPTLEPGTVVEYVVQSGDTAWSISRRFDTTVEAISAHNKLNDPRLIFAGTVLKIVVGDKTSLPEPEPAPTTQPTPTPRPANGGGGAKWIDVDLSAQLLVAYEGEIEVYRTLISGGTSRFPTVVGTFKIYYKLVTQDMSGGYGADAYYVPDVPHVMYFHQGGYAIHGAYWHNNFGTPMSHGCVNVPLDAAAWLYDWAPIGTSVTVHW